MVALIDGDVIVYRCGWASEQESEAIACIRANKTIEDILANTGATEHQVWLSDSLENNFRFKIDPLYKISRQSQPKPKWYWSIKQFLKNEWQAIESTGQEADDALGINQDKDGVFGVDDCGPYQEFLTTICTIDKDLMQVPGQHYNFVTKDWTEVSYLSGMISFYSQFLIGDRVDDIEGVKGLGKVKTKNLLGNCQNESELFDKVRYQYQDDVRLLKNGQLLWVRREPNQIWQFPLCKEKDGKESILQDESGESGNFVD